MVFVGNDFSDVLEKNIDSWKSNLLDISRRNRLINFKYKKNNTLKINNVLDELYNDLVLDGKELQVDTLNLDFDLNIDEDTKAYETVMKKLKKDRNTVMKEKGINILYLVFGLIKWKSHINAEEYEQAPLLLLPIEIVQKNKTSPFRIRAFEEDIQTNYTLSYKLKHEFGTELPEFKTDITVGEYIDSLEHIIPTLNKPEMKKEAFIGLMSFSKISMYRDMEKYKELIKEHPIVGKISTQSHVYARDEIRQINSIEPEQPALQNFQVLDADSSQMEAIMTAKQGYSFVLEGPPGTGKSQTIANIIAECIAQNKKVLFVSEKIAALEVVHKRLENVGLSEYCLELHSNKANKKSLITALYDSFVKQAQKRNTNISSYEQIDVLKYQLNSYVQALHKENDKYKITPYKLHGLLTAYSDIPSVNADLQAVEVHVQEKHNKIINLLENLDAMHEPIQKYKNAFWADLKEQSWTLSKQTELIENLDGYIDLILEIQLQAKQIDKEFRYTIPNSTTFVKILEIYKNLGDCKVDLNVEWLKKGSILNIKSFVESYYQIEENKHQVKSKLLEKYVDVEFENTTQLKNAILQVECFFDTNILIETLINGESEQLKTQFTQLRTSVQQIENMAVQLQNNIFKENKESIFISIHDVWNIIDLLKDGYKIPENWKNANEFLRIQQQVEQDLKIGKEISDKHTSIQTRVNVEEVNENLLNIISQIQMINHENAQKLEFYFNYRHELVGELKQLSTHLAQVTKHAQTLNAQLQLNRETTIMNVSALLESIDLMSRIQVCETEWLQNSGLKVAEKSAKEFFQHKQQLVQLKQQILQTWNEDIFDFFEQDPGIYERYRDKYITFFGKITSSYNRDKKALQRLLISSQGVDHNYFTQKLKELHQYYKLKNVIQQNEPLYEEAMGNLYDKLETDEEEVLNNYKLVKQFIETTESFGLDYHQKVAILKLKRWISNEFYDSFHQLKNSLELVKNLIRKYIENYQTLKPENTQPLVHIQKFIDQEIILATDIVKKIVLCEKVFVEKVVSKETFMEILQEIISYSEQLALFNVQSSMYEINYSHLFNGIATKWDTLEQAIHWYKTFNENMLQLRLSEEQQNSLRLFVENYSKELISQAHYTVSNSLDVIKQIVTNREAILVLNDVNALQNAVLKTYMEDLEIAQVYTIQISLYVAQLQKKRLASFTSYEEVTKDIAVIEEYQKLLSLSKHYLDESSDVLGTLVDLEKQDKTKLLNNIELNIDFLQVLESNNMKFTSCLLNLLNNDIMEQLSQYLNQHSVFNRYFDSILDKPIVDEIQSFEIQLELLKLQRENVDEIFDIVKIKNILASLKEYHLQEFLEKIFEKEILFNVSLKELFLKRYYEMALDEIYREDVLLQNFNRNDFENRIARFKELDQFQFESNARRIANTLDENIQQLADDYEISKQVSLLNRENNKKKAHLPVRTLLSSIPELFLSLKPCVMMSPLSVCEFLDPTKLQFDYVIFDEASQICPEDAIAPMIRGKNIVMAGDLKQMPPTNFFNATVTVDEDEYEDEDFEQALIESILSLCSDLMPTKTLKWHYRSRHESLIAFSNKHFYSNSLYTFPSVEIESEDYGVKFEYVEHGFFDRGGSRTNKYEAQRVAELVIEHFEKGNSQSLGVIAFSTQQSEEIQKQLEVMLKDKPQLENIIFNEEQEESFFIKNLENVQGDERDYIILSVAYAKDNNGKLYQQFGPLNKSGGERRLNVAITRAKSKLIVVSSMKDTEIDISKTNSVGAQLLRNYLSYARTGVLTDSILVNAENYFDSPFEQAVYNSLVQLGYQVKTQVGVSGYRIDLGIIDPYNPGKFILGVECDGATYHSSKTARDRDRLRQQVLENLGWTIYRVWSQDWFKNKDREVQKLKEYLDELVEVGS